MTAAVTQAKPGKPYEGFPLTAHGSGQWCKKIGGKRHYFGVWDDPDAAHEEFKRQFPYLVNGIEPPKNSMTVAVLLNHFDDHKKADFDAARINERTYKEYMAVAKVIADVLGRARPTNMISPLDLRKVYNELAIGKNGKPLSPVTLKRQLTFARMIFNYSNEFLDTNIKYRKALASPEKKLIRERRNKAGAKMFTAGEIRELLSKADPHLKAVIYLGINAGFGPSDCIEFTTDRINDGFVDYMRGKTAVQRRCPLWPETIKAINAVSENGRLLGTKKGKRGRPRRSWNRHMLGNDFQELCVECGIRQIGLYSLRRTLETIAKNAEVNQSVIDKIMGHERPDMSEVYNQTVFNTQLRKCTDFVRKWLKGRVKL